MLLSTIAQKQQTLAKKATENPEYKFNRLYDLLHWETWIHQAAINVLSRPGSRTDGVDGKTRDYFKQTYERQLSLIIEQLKSGNYRVW